MGAEDFRAVADAIAEDIARGRLRPGQRLPPQRRFARQRGIAPSTAARVYGELVRRGLAVGEVGRGTYVRAGPPPADTALAEPGGALVDLELNYLVLDGQEEALAASLRRLLRPGALDGALRPPQAGGGPGLRSAVADLLGRGGWAPDPDGVLFAGNGRQAIAAALAGLVPTGERFAVEEFTYPVVKGIAARLGIVPVPVAMDGEGMVPEALREAHRAAPLRAVYLQPTLHNPLGATMSGRRKRGIARVVEELGLVAVEDTVYAFLKPGPEPLAAHAPECTVVTDSLSKRVAPGLTLGFACAPPRLRDRVAGALRSGTWAATGFALEAAAGLVADGTVAGLVEGKRLAAERRQGIAAACLEGEAVTADPGAFHLWWELPEGWRAEAFTAAAARRGIAVTPASAFAVGRGRSPAAVRLALVAPGEGELRAALEVLARLARSSPEEAERVSS
ncbi:PLP-dependent aminotransferase family protein [Nocardiopsis sp. RSe5-2]|uniref:PLP-dependent aminotransferase family protein n=1 Tax=Nocardiopsis endophytica TaxID=3018445 RepID=A0ABT4U3I4_9ACTN|nr:PLP-dependent aminotransferase family protein [Nocardiopsis endophytica]MDA2811522.1 PLP-dependent aminotransferase family protein [Nocardiopsis endophytica]